MGKSLKGKELGKGIVQRKDGRYFARFVGQAGERIQGYFKTLQEARNWMDDARYCDRHGEHTQVIKMTVNEWFDFWFNNIVCDLAPNTLRNYRDRYRFNIKPIIGKMQITDVKPMHCKKVLVSMYDSYAGATIRQTFITMGTLFKAAIMNDIIVKHPMNGVYFKKPVKNVGDIKYLTVEEPKRFLEVAKGSHNYRQYLFLLETGLRTGEIIGLTWDAINWEEHTLTVNKTLEYRHGVGTWRAGPPKTATSYRTIPLTSTAYNILKELYDERDKKNRPKV